VSKGCCTSEHASDGCCPSTVQVRIDRPAAAVTPATPIETRYSGPSIPLTDLRPGQIATVREVALDAEDASMLRAMGLRVDMQVRVCRLGEPCIIELLGGRAATESATADCPRGHACTCRIGLSKPLARNVRVCVG